MDLLVRLKPECRQALATSIRRLPPEEWSLQVLTFVRDFAIINANLDRKLPVKRLEFPDFGGIPSLSSLPGSVTMTSNTVCVHGLDLLWAFIQDNFGQPASVEAIDTAVTLIVSLLTFLEGKIVQSSSFTSGFGTSVLAVPSREIAAYHVCVHPAAQLDAYESSQNTQIAVVIKTAVMQRCLSNLEANSSSPQSLRLLQVRNTFFLDRLSAILLDLWISPVGVCAVRGEHVLAEVRDVVWPGQEHCGCSAGVPANQSWQGPQAAGAVLQQLDVVPPDDRVQAGQHLW